MEDHRYLYLGLALVSLFVVFARRRRSAKALPHGLRLPPGPWQLPVVGTLHHTMGKLPHHAMRDLARRYGPVMLLQNGEVPTVVVSSREAAREVMKTQDIVFATRKLSATLSAVSLGGRDLIIAPYGDHWRQLRKIATTKLLSTRRVLSFRTIREEEVAAMLRGCAVAAAESRPVDMRELMCTLIADTTMLAMMGVRCRDREDLMRELDIGIKLVAGFNPTDLWPSSWIVSRLCGDLRRAEVTLEAVFRILDGIIKEHLERMDANGSSGEVEDLLHVLLKIHKEGGQEMPLDMDVIKLVTFNIFAGSETTAPLLEWAVAELIRNPRVMRRATEEVRRAFGAHGSVREDRLPGKLPYLQLVIRETFRLHAPIPLLIPRASREPCRLLGYDVPQGITVLVNAWAMGRDERYWPGDPEVFRPERFEVDGAADLRGNDFELVPFGAGRRMCPGMSFALCNIELALASLLFHFDWEALSDPAKLDMTEEFGLVARRKGNLPLQPILRVPVPEA
ncbi:hypothetical protein EJB05_03217 [Eragrostis curvula]|uniref:Cytochrome P450 n=1 Tax=Eragrostis curvula TaxID=38414 RepID=A0A5J9WUL1_9POAL|nr:hypothetical protein EJB05_03217 [Eragrostis curvula]